MQLIVLLTVLSAALSKEAPTSLQIGIVKKASVCPTKASKGDKLQMEYTGKLLQNGKQFDSSIGRAPFEFTLGVGQVIKGWDQGILGMCIGEKRKLTIPSELGYGSAGAGSSIPPNAALVFDIELLKINGKGEESIKSESEL